VSYCVVALFERLCVERGLDPSAILRKADVGNSPRLAFDEIREQAEWERTVYPQWWDPGKVERLLDALAEVGYAPLAKALEEALTAGQR
jgi:hypothetical protein